MTIRTLIEDLRGATGQPSTSTSTSRGGIRRLVNDLGALLGEDFRPGTVRKWKSGTFIKKSDGSWSPYNIGRSGGSKPTSSVPSKEPAKEPEKEPAKSKEPSKEPAAAPAKSSKSPSGFKSHPDFAGTDKDTEQLYKKDGEWTPERKKLHDAYVAKTNEGVPKSAKPTVYMTGGGPASGKTVALLNNPRTRIPNAARAVHSDPDGAKGFIPEYVENKDSDKSAAARVHEESSYMSQEAVKAGLAGGRDVVYDSTGDSGIAKLSAKVKKMREQGAQRVVAHYATVDVDEALRRSDARAAKSGRFVPHAYIQQCHKDVTRTVLAAIDQGVYDSLDLWDNSKREPVHVASYTREDGLKIDDKEAWEAFKKRGE